MVYASLGHEFSTDIMKITLPLHDINLDMPEGTTPKDQYLSVLYALLEGASSALDISRNDINGCVTGNNEIILFDDTAGGSGLVKHIYNNFETVLKEAKRKVSEICGCTEETSCYGCLRNYSNQFYHDEISRGLAYHYLDWVLNGEGDPYIVITHPDSLNEEEEDSIGLRRSNYEVPDASDLNDTETELESLLEDADDDSFRRGIKKLLEYARGKRYEKPVVDDCIPVETSIWPDIFWGESHVALFSKEKEAQYRILKKYDWY